MEELGARKARDGEGAVELRGALEGLKRQNDALTIRVGVHTKQGEGRGERTAFASIICFVHLLRASAALCVVAGYRAELFGRDTLAKMAGTGIGRSRFVEGDSFCSVCVGVPLGGGSVLCLQDSLWVCCAVPRSAVRGPRSAAELRRGVAEMRGGVGGMKLVSSR
jgi:hypothetical protein